jgi:hypothetical protein
MTPHDVRFLMKPCAATRYIHRPRAVLALALLPALIGCSGKPAMTVFDASAVLAGIEQDRRRHDPHAYSEVDLGEFAVTWRQKPDETDRAESREAAEQYLATLIIRFHLYAVVPDHQVEECKKLLEASAERVRSKVREVVQGSDFGEKRRKDPTLNQLKSDLIQAINQSLQAPILRDVAFGEFGVDRS